MRILHILRAVQHPTVLRGALRHYHFLRILARRHEVTLLALADREVPPAAMGDLESLTERMVLFRAGRPRRGDPAEPKAMERVARKLRLRKAARRMGAALRTLSATGEYDVLLFHGKRAYPALAGYRQLPTVVDFCDATTLRHRERLRHAAPWALPWRAGGYLAASRTEEALLRHTPHVAFISARDREAVVGNAERGRVIPNGIDLEYWSPAGRGAPAEADAELVFTGVMDYDPNEHAAMHLIDEVLPGVRARRPDARLVLAGRSPSPALVRAAGRVHGVQVTGFVEDLRPHLESAHLFVAPIQYASGLQNKVLEAMALGVPVVTTPIVAEGLRLERGDPPPVAVADPGDAFARTTIDLLADDERRRALAREGRRFVETHFDWERSAELLEELCLEAIETARGTPVGPEVSR